MRLLAWRTYYWRYYYIEQGRFCHWGRGGWRPPRRNASYLGGKELGPMFAHCTHHYSFPLQKIIQNLNWTLYMNKTNVYVRKISVLVREGRKIREGSQQKCVFCRNDFCSAPLVNGLQKRFWYWRHFFITFVFHYSCMNCVTENQHTFNSGRIVIIVSTSKSLEFFADALL